ncbi:MAG: MMPL family transporter [Deltaproteobacteria bacterium]|nr:MMPL family transporter [Deltaproteobacteria bacterium]
MQSTQRSSLLFDRWPRYAARKPWTVVISALLIIVALGVTSSVAGGEYNDNFSIPNTESQDAFDLLSERFQGFGGGDAATVVLKAEAGFDDPEVEAAVAELVAEFNALPGVVLDNAVSPYDADGSISEDRTIARFDVNYLEPAFSISVEDREALLELRDEVTSDAIQVELGGSVPNTQQEEQGLSELVGLGAAIIILLVAFGSVVAMGLPILTAMLGLIPGFMLIALLTRFVDLASFTPQFVSMIALGVGIDYALLIVTRFREGITNGLDRTEAIVRASSTAGKAVLFAGSIVVISLFGLWASGLPFIGWIGSATAMVVAILVIVALFILPAVLSIIGGSIDRWPVPFIAKKQTSGEQGAGTRWARLIARYPVVWLILALVLLGTVASPTLSIRLGSADAGNNPESTTTRRAYDLLSEGFGAGFNGPILVVFDITNENGLTAIEKLPDSLQDVEGIAFATEPFVNPDGDAALMTVIATTAPQDEATGETVDRLRAFLQSELAGSGATAFTGGLTAIFIDIATKMSEGLPIFTAAVIGLSVILLMVVFRSVLVPLKAALMIALSVGVGFGVVTAVFQWGWGLGLIGLDSTGPVESFLPMMLFAVLFGLSMDYEVFLMTRVHEEFKRTGDGKLAVERGQAMTFRVIIAAGLIMSSVFFAFALGEQRVIKEFGIGLGTAIITDALIVRMVLVPSIMHLFGNAAWWFPRWLDRALPNLSVEAAEAAPAPAGGDK